MVDFWGYPLPENDIVYRSYQKLISKPIGSYFEIIRYYYFTDTELDSSDTLSKAWFTVKADPTDIDANAAFQKIITTTDVAGSGQIEGSNKLRFEVLHTDTASMTVGQNYYYDIKVLSVEGRIIVKETGKFIPQGKVTVAVS